MSDLLITPAGIHQLGVVLGIIDEAARWLISRGIQQWESPPPAECGAVLERAIAGQNVYLVRHTGSPDPIGTFRLEWNADAACLYNLALRPKCVGKGIGKQVVNWVADHLRERGIVRFRLDCIAANESLRRWYESLGFGFLRIVRSGDYILALYELCL